MFLSRHQLTDKNRSNVKKNNTAVCEQAFFIPSSETAKKTQRKIPICFRIDGTQGLYFERFQSRSYILERRGKTLPPGLQILAAGLTHQRKSSQAKESSALYVFFQILIFNRIY